MAGWGERRTRPDDDFWSWRETIYRFLDRLTPDDLEVVATFLYVEMVEAGYRAVTEFHYLHLDPEGCPYADPSETAMAHVRAAEKVGIDLTLAPVLYTYGGFGRQRPDDGQRRFILQTDSYLRLLEKLKADADRMGFHVAASLHSLRAVCPEQVAEVVAASGNMAMHIHVAEQEKEVSACLAWSGLRPVEWLMEHAGLDSRWRLVHATHMTPEEATRAAATGAAVVLCPSTEANLGDGFFQADAWMTGGGRWGIGGDSHVCVDPREELRLFEYGRRLSTCRRSLAATPETPSPGARLWREAARLEGHLEASGDSTGYLIVDAGHPSLAGKSGDDVIDALIFAPMSRSPVRQTWVGGRQLTEDGRHPLRGEAEAAYVALLKRIYAS